MTKKTINLGHRIMEALTAEQIATLIDTVGSKVLLEKIEEKGACLDNDIVETVRNVIKSTDTTGNNKCEPEVDATSDSKFIEEWDALWQRWSAVVMEVGDEDGRYSVQDRHWEPPYFDGLEFSADIEKIAIEMVPRIDRIFFLVDEPALFIDAIEEIEDAIRSYPDWMGVCEGEGCTLEYHTSRCILQWLWIGCKDHERPGSVFLTQIANIGSKYTLVNLDCNAVVSFILEMNPAVCREFYTLMAGGLFQKEQESVYSPWNTIMLEFKQRYDKEAYFSQCTRDLEKNWRLGIPLVENAYSNNDWNSTETLLFKTFASYRRYHPKGDWFPETSLLFSKSHYHSEINAANELARLLQIWGDVSEKKDNRERAVAARFQEVMVHNSDDIDAVTNLFTTMRKKYEFPALDKLFRQWQDDIALASFRWCHNKHTSVETWLHWAIATQVEGTDGTARFRKQLDAWLFGLSGSSDEFVKHWKELATITVDLCTSTHRDKYSGLFATAFQEFNTETDLDKSRRSLVGRLCCTETVEKMLDIWKKLFSHLIPNPATSSSDYLRPVAWVKVLFDLNPQAYSLLVGLWKVNHRRRINLWKAMRNAKLPVD
ncbi:MAG: hypothetical protein JW915_14005 [Chitinispirillaceae bacterium]|nr:hypothetical protein [Chitinispirillaceae bacterium]